VGIKVLDRVVAQDKEVGIQAADVVAVAAFDGADALGSPFHSHSIQEVVLPDSQN
jgi:hypothetical protein